MTQNFFVKYVISGLSIKKEMFHFGNNEYVSKFLEHLCGVLLRINLKATRHVNFLSHMSYLDTHISKELCLTFLSEENFICLPKWLNTSDIIHSIFRFLVVIELRYRVPQHKVE